MDAWTGIPGATIEFESADPFMSIGVSCGQQVDPADEDVTVTPPATLTHLQVWVVETPGAPVGNNGLDAIVQAAEKDSGTNQPNIDFATMTDVVNNMFLALMACVGPTPRFQGATPEDAEWGFQQVDVDTLADSTGEDTSGLLQYVVGLDETNPNIQGFTGGGFSGGAGIGLEIAEEPAGGSVELVVEDAAHGHTADGVALVQAHVLVPADSAHAHDAEAIVLEATFVAGTVTLSATPVEGATIRAIGQSDGAVFTTTTDSNGDYILGVAAGQLYHVVVEYEDGGSQKYNALSLWDVTAVGD